MLIKQMISCYFGHFGDPGGRARAHQDMLGPSLRPSFPTKNAQTLWIQMVFVISLLFWAAFLGSFWSFWGLGPAG